MVSFKVHSWPESLRPVYLLIPLWPGILLSDIMHMLAVVGNLERQG